MKHWWRVVPGAAFVFLMASGSTIVFDETCYGVVFDNYGMFNYYDCLPTAEGSHLPAPLGGWILMIAGVGMLYLALFPFIHGFLRWNAHPEVSMAENQPSDTTQKTVTIPRQYRGSALKWKITAIAAIASLLSVFMTLIITGTNRDSVNINTAALTPSAEAPLSGSDWIVWNDAEVQYMSLGAALQPGDTSESLFVDVGCYSDYAMMIWISWTTDVAYWGTDEDVEAALRITEPDGSTMELFGRILPPLSTDVEAHTHYFSVKENDDAFTLAGLLATSSELRLEIFADIAYWGPDENSYPRDTEFVTHASGVVYPGLFDTYLLQLTSCPYQEFYGVG